jgi:hypothetical protein
MRLGQFRYAARAPIAFRRNFFCLALHRWGARFLILSHWSTRPER